MRAFGACDGSSNLPGAILRFRRARAPAQSPKHSLACNAHDADMTEVTISARIPKEMDLELRRLMREEHLEKSAALRKLLHLGLETYRQESALRLLAQRRATLSPIRSLADAADVGERCLQVARKHGAVAHHDITSNAVHVAQPQSLYQALVNFSLHGPNRSKALRGPRSLIETAFYWLKTRFGHRLGCRTKRARINEILTKAIAHNLSVLTARTFMTGP